MMLFLARPARRCFLHTENNIIAKNPIARTRG